MKDLLADILLSAAAEMWRHDPTLGEYTAETAEHELNLAFHYAAELPRWFPWLHCDFDVTKVNFSRERPDIILHRRRSNAANYLVIEIKRERSRQDVPADLEQIRTRWFTDHLRYRYGASLILDEDHRTAEVCALFRDDPEPEMRQKLCEHSRLVGAPDTANEIFTKLQHTVARLAESTTVDSAALERQIDDLIKILYGRTLKKIKSVEGAAR